jgi:hypothetical protein
MNFGKWIVMAFVLFAIFIGTLVTVCVKQDISLVSKNYYKDELVYQEQIKRINNTTQLLQKPTVTKSGNNIVISFHKQFKIGNGQVKFFCPSNSDMDKEFELDIAGDNTQTFNTSLFQKGMYKAKLMWTMDGKQYYYEEIINI